MIMGGVFFDLYCTVVVLGQQEAQKPQDRENIRLRWGGSHNLMYYKS